MTDIETIRSALKSLPDAFVYLGDEREPYGHSFANTDKLEALAALERVALGQAVVDAAIRWRNSDVYVHPILDRSAAVKIGVADLCDAINKYDACQQAQAIAKIGEGK